jgi:putative DNA primase/helicase
MGPKAGPIAVEMLLMQKYPRSAGSPTPENKALRGMLFVFASESEESVKINSGKVKLYSGGDTLIARGPYDRREIRFTPSFTLFLLTNFKPRANPRDHALWQRLHVINFPICFVDNPTKPNERLRNPHLREQLRAEGPGILAWMIRGYHSYLEKGLAPPPEVLQQTEAYRKSEDSVTQFIEENCEVSESLKSRGKELYEAYKKFCEGIGFKAINGNSFFNALSEDFEKKKGNKGKIYKGIGLKDIFTETNQVTA